MPTIGIYELSHLNKLFPLNSQFFWGQALGANRMQDKYIALGDNYGAPAMVPVDADGNPTPALATPSGGLLVGGSTPFVTASMVRLDEATAGNYSIGDIIANSTTAASVVPISFEVGDELTGRIIGCRCILSAASGTIVLPSFDLILFRPATNIPFTAGSYPADNAALTLTTAADIQRVCKFAFSSLAWENPTGGATASGDHVTQSVGLSSGLIYAPFSLVGLTGGALLGLLRAQSAWAPGHVDQTFNFVLFVDPD